MCPAVAEHPDVDVRPPLLGLLVIGQKALDHGKVKIDQVRPLQDALHDPWVAADAIAEPCRLRVLLFTKQSS